MSWDVLFQDLPPGIRSVSEIPDDFRPGFLCARPELLATLLAVAPSIDLSDPTWGVLEGDGFSIELDIREGDPVESLMLHIRGGEGAFVVVRELARALGRPAIDCSAGELIDFDAPDAMKGFRAWRAYRDRIVGDSE